MPFGAAYWPARLRRSPHSGELRASSRANPAAEVGSLLVPGTAVRTFVLPVRRVFADTCFPRLLIPSNFCLPPVEYSRGNRPHPRCQVSPFSEFSTVANRRHQRGRRHRADPRDRCQPLASLVLLRHLPDNHIHLFDAGGELVEFHVPVSQQDTKINQRTSRKIRQNPRQRVIDMTAGPCGSVSPRSSRRPRI